VQPRTIAQPLVTPLAALALVTGCGGDDDESSGGGNGLSGRIQVDGSSTVAPLATLAAERFGRENSDVKVTVGVSGTGGGFERFCAGETDISDASRPIEDDEKAACASKGIDFTELEVANDALTVVVNPANDWATCLTTAQLKQIWQPGSKVKSWKDVDASFPDETLELYGPGTDSGTFDYFTDAINGEEGASRSDYSASEDDNVLVQGVSGEKGALGYFGFSYYDQNQDKLKALEIDAGDGCVAPSIETAQDGSYRPLSRPLFMYVKRESLQKTQVKAFVRYLLDNSDSLSQDALFVPLTSEQRQQALSELDSAAGGG
jgi:phosphate transport system substrate-binding protein